MSVPPPAIQSIDPDLTTPYNLNTSIGYRRELTTNLGIDVSYVYNRGWDQVMTVDRNAGIPGTANIFGQGALGRNPAIASDTFSTNLGFIRYKGLLVDLRKRLSRGIQGGLAYTLSKTEDNGLSFGSVIQVPSRPDLNTGPAANDRRHEVKAHLEVELPFDIQWAGILEHYSEAPLNVNAARDINGDGLLNDWVNEEICRTVSCPGFHYSRNSVRELSTDDANRLRSLLRARAGDAVRQQPEVSQPEHDPPEDGAFRGPPGARHDGGAQRVQHPAAPHRVHQRHVRHLRHLRGRRPAARHAVHLPIRLVNSW